MRVAFPCVLLLSMGAGACGPRLPSLEPLGEGPLAESEPVPVGGREAARRPPRIARAAAPTPAADAGLGTTDAATGGSGDAGAAASADASTAVETEAPSGFGPWIVAGEYLGPDYTDWDVPGWNEDRDDDPNARTLVELGAAGTLHFVIVNSLSGEPICRLEAAARGDEAKVAAGQSCFEGGEVVKATVIAGQGRFSDHRLELDFTLDLEAIREGESFTGEVEYHFDGRKK